MVYFEIVCFVSVVSLLYRNREFDVSFEPKHTEDQPKQFDREHILVFFRKFRVVSVCFETVLFNSVVLIKVQIPKQAKTNRKFFVFGFKKQTETQPKQILFWFVSVRTDFFLFVLRTP